MAELSFVEYVRSTGLTGGEAFCLLTMAGFAVLAVAAAVGLYRGRHLPTSTKKAAKERSSDWKGMLSFLAGAGITGFFGYSIAHVRYQLDYQLRPDASRYTIGEVYRHSARKKGPVYEYRYRVRSQSYEGTTTCQSRACPPIGIRFYITFALADHSLSQCTGEVVPDTVQTAPALGWPTLP
ncbi:hypothetical protein [Hymenobacter negativus]|uniref:DUF3592 domain-containing protein n=1 Tax=Hymenobacter negativus TaxID=2795026 RepID=A0ABS3QC92_9BACT|nr:hypothetical protein [Hymenobacter negativus]MBO2008867.1 hypothetical protein [Hymenobacter negativus]